MTNQLARRRRISSVRLMAALGLALGFAATACTTVDDSGSATSDASFAGETPAPELPEGLPWLNTDGNPTSLAALRGRVVALNFWSASCVACIHVNGELSSLRSEFGESLAVVGVHVPRFGHEEATESVRQAVMKLGIDYPVVNDSRLAIWNQWGAASQPTIALIDPAGNAVGIRTGEGAYDALAPIIAGLIDEFPEAAQPASLVGPLERDAALATVLAYPEGVAVDTSGARAYIADTGHNRIVAIDLPSGDVTAVYGSGTAALADGSGPAASFASPRGLALSPDGSTLYVADTGNHVIRAVRTSTGEVNTVAGTGDLGAWPPSGGGSLEVGLRSPWDLALDGSSLFVAMAGSHQLWLVDLSDRTATPVAGSGIEGVADGAAADAQLTRPSAVAVDSASGRVYFTDPESSSVRFFDPATGEVRTVAGATDALFVHGDEDGIGTNVRMQHPAGISINGGLVLVADTYNHKLKTVTDDGAVTTLVGGGAGWRDGVDPRFYEPGALEVVGDTIYLADTNNHALRVVDLTTGNTETLVLRGIEDFTPDASDANYAGTIVELEPIQVAPRAGTVVIDVTLPANHKINEDAPSSVEWISEGDVATFPSDVDLSLTGASFPVSYPVEFHGEGTLIADLNLFWCANDAASLCFIEQVRILAPILVDAGGGSEVRLPHEIVLPELPG